MPEPTGRVEKWLLSLNAALALMAVGYLMATPGSFLRRPVDTILRRWNDSRALTQQWAQTNASGAWYVTPASASQGDTVVIFSNYACPYCRKQHQIFQEIRATSKLPPIKYRTLLPAGDPFARFAARVAVCADAQGLFGPVHHYLMERTAWQDAEPDSVIASLPMVNELRLRKCLNSPMPDKALSDDEELAEKLSLVGTPSLVTSAGIKRGLMQPKAFKEWSRSGSGASD